jgi:succinate-semialdehyde dehydrogenase/glutarate-semialdehyde dehydrogenase
VAWGARSVEARCAVLRDVRAAILDDRDALVDLIARESGKPRHEALLHEVMAPLELLTTFTDAAPRLLAPTPIPLRLMKHRGSWLHYVPRGVVGVIGPWNFPHNIPFGAAAMALLAGNGVVLKPSEFTPLVARHVHALYLRAGVPEDLFQLVQGPGEVGAVLIEAGVDMVTFTGSVATGRRVGALCGARIVPCVLELGGKAPALVLEDADLDRAVHAVLWGAFANCGQVCASVERVLVHTSLYEPFVERLVAGVRALRLGDPVRSAEVDHGPLQKARQRDVVEALVADAVAKGATVRCGGARPEGLDGLYLLPTVLTGVTRDMDIATREIFGPVVTVQPMPDDAAMIAETNDSHLGLLAYVFSRDPDRAARVAEQLAAGTVMVNDVITSHAMPETPWAGVKQSGIGSTHGEEGLRQMCQVRHVNVDVLPWLTRERWWFPYRAPDLRLLGRALAALYGRGMQRWRGLLRD